jgi:hypothetical protein
MKSICFLLLTIFSFAACKEKDLEPDPDIHTVQVTYEQMKSNEAVKKMSAILYDAYQRSDKSKAFYEVVYGSVGGYILNYYPKDKLLSVCTDNETGDSWGYQYKDVDEAKLKELSEAALGFYEYHNILVRNTPANFEIIKTNGRP